MAQENPYLQLVQDDLTGSVKNAMQSAADKNPDVEAKLMRLAKTANVPLEAVRLDQPTVERQVALESIDYKTLAQKYPSTAQLLADPVNAALAKDDVEKISFLEDTLNFGANFGRSLAASIPSASAGIYGAAQAGVDVAAGATDPLIGRILPANPLNAISSKLGEWRKTALADSKAIEGDQAGMGFVQKSALSGAKSLGQNLMLLPVSVLSGSPAPMLYGMSAITGGNAYGQARDKGVSVPGSVAFASSQAMIEYATEKVPALYLMRDIGMKASFKKMLFNQASKELPNEQYATVLQDLNEWAVLNPAKPFSEYLSERPSAAAQTLIATMVSTGGQVAITKAADRLANGPREKQAVNILNALKEGVIDSKTFERAPERVKDFIAKHTANGPMENIFIPAEQLQQYFQTAQIDPEAAAAEMGAKNYAEALATGGDVVIPLAEFITSTAKTPHYDGLINDIRFVQGEMTAREADLYEKNHPDEIRKMIEDAQSTRLPDLDVAPAVTQLTDDMTGQLVAGGMEQGTASSYAQTYAKVMQNLAERSGMDPMALHQKYGLQIVRPMADVLTNIGTSDIQIDPLLDMLRNGDMPTGMQINGPSLIEFIRSIGGVNDAGGELRQMEVDKNKAPFVRNLAQLTGRGIDEVTELAKESGYPVRDLLDAIEAEIAGNPTYSAHYANDELQGRARDLASLGEYLNTLGIDLATASNDDVRTAMAAAVGTAYDQSSVDESTGLPLNPDGTVTVYHHTSAANAALIRKTGKLKAQAEPDVYVTTRKETDTGYGDTAVAVNVDPALLQIDDEFPDGRVDYRIDAGKPGGSVPVKFPDEKLFQPAYHGTPYQFDKFSLDHLGKGEGAQAFGWGLYFAGNKAIAEYYRRTLSDSSDKSTVSVNGVQLEDKSPENHAARLLYHNDARQIKTLAKQMLQEAKAGEAYTVDTAQRAGLDAVTYYTRLGDFLTKYKRKDITVAKGQLYEVEIPEDDVMLLWDKPLSGQPEAVKAALKKAGIDKEFKANLSDFGSPQNTRGKGNGSNIYSFLAYKFGNEATAPLRAERASLIAKYNENGNLLAARTKMTPEDRARDSEISMALVELQGKGDELASKYLNDLNIKGIKYKADTLGPGATGKAGFNYVVFDDAAIDILNKYYQQYNKDKRGYIQFGADRKFKIALLENADLSTFLHETGHFWLEVMGDLATGANATDQIKADYSAILKFLKVESREQIGVEQHELFARANEAYLMEGKSPSPELRAVFQRFKAWLTMIYKSMDVLNVKLSDEVRGVFNRIYAADAEIDAAQDELDMPALFATAQDAGMTEQEFSAYKGSIAAATERSKDELRAKLMRQFAREKLAWWNDELDKMRADVGAEVDAQPVYQAFDALTKGELPDGTPFKLDKQALIDQFGKAYIKKLPRGYGEGRGAVFSTDGGGLRHDAAADLLGYGSGAELVEALVNMRPRKELIEAEAKKRMVEKHGDLLTDGTIADEATTALHNEERGNILRTELQALNKELSKDMLPPTTAFRDAARGLIGQSEVRDIRPYSYLLAEKKAARQAFAAMGEGRRLDAFEAKKREMLNHYLYREATKAMDDVDAIQSKMRNLAKKPAQERIGKAGATYLDQINALIDQYEFAKVPLRELDRRQSLLDWYNQQIAAGLEPAIDSFLIQNAQQQNYRTLQMDQLRAIRDAAVSIEHMAKFKNRLMKAAEKKEFDAVIEELVVAGEENNAQVFRPFDEEQRTIGQKTSDWFANLDRQLVNVRTMVSWLDGGKADGPWHRYLFNPASEAQTALLDLTKSVGKEVNDLMESFLEKNADRMTDTFKTPLGTMSRKKVMSIAFNYGTDVNYDKMLRGGPGRGKTWTAAQLDDIVRNLDAKDWQFIQGVWTIMDTRMYPAISELTKRMSGVPLEKKEARAFTVMTKDGQEMRLDGGYYPIKYDSTYSAAGQKQDTGPMAGLTGYGYVTATTPRGHTKSVMEGYAAPMELNFGLILSQHLAGAIKDLTHREFLLDSQRILRDDRIRQVLQERLGEPYEKEFMAWLTRIANDGNTSPADALTWVDKTVEFTRTNATILSLGFKATTIMAQAAGLFNAIEHPNVGAGWFARGFKEFTAHPLESYQLVTEKSGEMRHRFDTLDQSVREVLNQNHGSTYGKVKDGLVRSAFVGINIADRFVTIPTWMGAYRKALSAGMTEGAAIHAADDAVVGSQGAAGPKDLNALQGARGSVRLFTMFYTPFAAAYNRARSIGREAGQKGWTHTPEAVGRMMMITFLPAIMADLLTARGPNECDAGDSECYAKWLSLKMVGSVTSLVPGVRDMGNMLEQYASGNPSGYKGSPIIGVVDRAGKSVFQGFEAAFGDREFDSKLAFDLMDTAGFVAGLPVGQATIAGENMWMRLNGDDGDVSWLRDLAFRRQYKP